MTSQKAPANVPYSGSLNIDAANADDGTTILNRHSRFLTNEHDFPPARVSKSRFPCTSMDSDLKLDPGGFIRCWSARQRVNANDGSRRDCFSLVGGQSVQVRSFQRPWV